MVAFGGAVRQFTGIHQAPQCAELAGDLLDASSGIVTRLPQTRSVTGRAAFVDAVRGLARSGAAIPPDPSELVRTS